MIQNKQKNKYILIIFIVILTTIIVITFGNTNNKGGKVIINGIDIQKVNGKNKIGVYIDGEVKNPGFIHIEKGQNLENALNKIGGITDSADIQKIDLKKTLKDGEKIIIPSKMKYDEENNIDINKDDERDAVVNINSASKEELKTLEGIGDKTAERIIEYRNSKYFEYIEEITNVKGIGKAKYEKIKNNICV